MGGELFLKEQDVEEIIHRASQLSFLKEQEEKGRLTTADLAKYLIYEIGYDPEIVDHAIKQVVGEEQILKKVLAKAEEASRLMAAKAEELEESLISMHQIMEKHGNINFEYVDPQLYDLEGVDKAQLKTRFDHEQEHYGPTSGIFCGLYSGASCSASLFKIRIEKKRPLSKMFRKHYKISAELNDSFLKSGGLRSYRHNTEKIASIDQLITQLASSYQNSDYSVALKKVLELPMVFERHFQEGKGLLER